MKSALLVLGATGKVGRGIVAAAVAAGRPVIAVARRMSELVRLRDAHPGADLAIVKGSVADDARSERLAQAVRRIARPIGGVVATLCAECDRGRVLDQPTAALRRAFADNVASHASAARHLLPLLAEGGRTGGYVLIGGPGGEQPWAGYAHRSIVSASLRMLARVLHEEARSLAVRVQLLAVDSPLRDADNSEHACESWPTADAIARRALQLVDGQPGQPAKPIVRYASLPDSRPDASLEDARRLLDTLVPFPA